jgi:hypothetical protein
MTRVARERIYAVSKDHLHAPAVISPRYLRLQTCKRRQHKKRVLNCLQSIGGERSSAGRASVCGTEGRGFKSRRSPQNSFSLMHLHLLNRRLLVPSFRIGNDGEQIAKLRPFLLKGTFPEKFTARLKKSCDVRVSHCSSDRRHACPALCLADSSDTLGGTKSGFREPSLWVKTNEAR